MTSHDPGMFIKEIPNKLLLSVLSIIPGNITSSLPGIVYECVAWVNNAIDNERVMFPWYYAQNGQQIFLLSVLSVIPWKHHSFNAYGIVYSCYTLVNNTQQWTCDIFPGIMLKTDNKSLLGIHENCNYCATMQVCKRIRWFPVSIVCWPSVIPPP